MSISADSTDYTDYTDSEMLLTSNASLFAISAVRLRAPPVLASKLQSTQSPNSVRPVPIFGQRGYLQSNSLHHSAGKQNLARSPPHWSESNTKLETGRSRSEIKVRRTLRQRSESPCELEVCLAALRAITDVAGISQGPSRSFKGDRHENVPSSNLELPTF